MNPSPTPRTLGDDDRAFLLELARLAISCRLRQQDLPSRTPDSPVLNETRGAFVTLKIEGLLRGCIGHVFGVSPLWKSVRDNAVSAAFEDPRFPPLAAEEFDRVDLEISALTPLREVAPDEVVVGRDGVLIERGASRGLLLPQVATEYGWDLETFLDHTCRKAGLEKGCWRHPESRISVFAAEVFKEKERPAPD